MYDYRDLAALLEDRHASQEIVFTNGCFDVIHRGHVEFLQQAKSQGDVLVVALNTDESVARIKGPGRPVNSLENRAVVLESLAAVDYVTYFEDATPIKLIETLAIDVLVKGDDWPQELIVGASPVRRRGGRVVSLSSTVPELSSTAILRRLQLRHEPGMPDAAEAQLPPGDQEPFQILKAELDQDMALRRQILHACGSQIVELARMVGRTLHVGGKIYLFGNGGSAADAQHIAAELVGRFRKVRDPFPAVALTTDSSVVTAIANDFDFAEVFARQVTALVRSGDTVIGISTSGKSQNVLRALMRARDMGAETAALTSTAASRLAAICDVAVLVPATDPARIQEVHITVGHCIVALVERLSSWAPAS